MVVWCPDGSWACGAWGTTPFLGFGVHWFAPAGLLVRSYSYPCRFSRKLLSHFVGWVVHGPSRPLVMVSAPLPVPWLFFQPSCWSSIRAPSGSGPTVVAGEA